MIRKLFGLLFYLLSVAIALMGGMVGFYGYMWGYSLYLPVLIFVTGLGLAAFTWFIGWHLRFDRSGL